VAVEKDTLVEMPPAVLFHTKEHNREMCRSLLDGHLSCYAPKYRLQVEQKDLAMRGFSYRPVSQQHIFEASGSKDDLRFHGHDHSE
jgi:hypothetical protein